MVNPFIKRFGVSRFWLALDDKALKYLVKLHNRLECCTQDLSAEFLYEERAAGLLFLAVGLK